MFSRFARSLSLLALLTAPTLAQGDSPTPPPAASKPCKTPAEVFERLRKSTPKAGGIDYATFARVVTSESLPLVGLQYVFNGSVCLRGEDAAAKSMRFKEILAKHKFDAANQRVPDVKIDALIAHLRKTMFKSVPDLRALVVELGGFVTAHLPDTDRDRAFVALEDLKIDGKRARGLAVTKRGKDDVSKKPLVFAHDEKAGWQIDLVQPIRAAERKQEREKQEREKQKR